MIGSQIKEGILDTAKRITLLQEKINALEKTLKKLSKLDERSFEELEEIDQLLQSVGYNGITAFYLLRAKRNNEKEKIKTDG